MSVTQLESIEATLRDRTAKAMAAYRELVRAYVHDESPDLVTVEKTLQDAGKEIHELKADIATAKRRDGLRAAVNLAAELQAGRPAVQKKIDAAKAKLAKAQAEFDAVMQPLRLEIQAIDNAGYQASIAESELHRTAPDDFDARADELRMLLGRASHEVKARKIHLSEMQSRFATEANAKEKDFALLGELQGAVERAEASLQLSVDNEADLLRQQNELVEEMKAA